MNKPFSFKQRY